MIVVVDTNQFHGDPRMALRNFRVLLAQHEHGTLQLAIPEVVLRELPKMYRSEYEAVLDRVNSGLQKLRGLGQDPGAALALPGADDAQEKYADWLRSHLAERRVRTPELPIVDLSELVDHSVAERRPWQPNSKGFRDALIWRTVVDLANEDTVVLVTKNWRDFAESEKHKDVLHPDLRSDMVAMGHGEQRVRLVPSLLDYINHYVSSKEQHLYDPRIRLKTDRQWRNGLWDQIEHALWRLELDTWDDVTVVHSEYAEIDNIDVADVSIEDVQIANAYETDNEGFISLELQVHAVLYFTFTTDTGGMEWLAKENADIQFDIHEETFSQGSTLARYLTVTYGVDYAADTGELGEMEKISAVEDHVRI
jgi:hypothetical protein